MSSSTSSTSSVLNNVTAGQAAQQTAGGLASLTSNFQQFLSLLTTQLQNQDPLNPMDTNQFTQQLVQMTGVQQQLLTNNLLTTLVSQGLSSGVNYIGKTVTASEPNQTLSNGQATWTYNLPSTATSAQMVINDASGNAVWTGAAPDLTAGTHNVTWNGTNFNGTQLKDGGTYTLVITAKDATGNAITSQVTTTGVVDAVTQNNGTTYLNINGASVPMSSVLTVQDTASGGSNSSSGSSSSNNSSNSSGN